MEPGIKETKSETESADVLLDLGDIEPAHATADEFVLDLEDASGDEAAAPVYEAAGTGYEASRVYEASSAYEAQSAYEASSAYDAPSAYEPSPAHEPASMRAFVEPEVTETPAPAHESSYQPDVHSSFAETQEIPYESEARESYKTTSVPPELTPDPVPVFGETEFPIAGSRSEEHTSELQSLAYLVCRLLLEKKS